MKVFGTKEGMAAMCPAPTNLLIRLWAVVLTVAPAAAEDGLRVRLVEDYSWPSSQMIGDVAVDIFPLVDALVVDRPSGPPLTADDEESARAAARRHCMSTGGQWPGDAPVRFDKGAFAFPACRP